MKRKVICLLAAAALCSAARADKVDMDSFQIRDGFQLELFASEPIVMDPAEMIWDENGLIYVIEMAGYPIASALKRPFPGRIAVIEDTDGDGVCDKRTLFADDFQYAASILPYRGGIFVGDPPNMLYMKDTDGDRKADVREVVLEGFSVGNSQHNYCGLNWGLDGWIYGATGGNDGEVHLPGKKGEAVSISNADFRYHPEKKLFETVGESGGGYGIAFDDYGRWFTTHNTAHFQHMVFPQRYLDRNRHLHETGTLIQAATYNEGGLTRVFPIGAPETRVNHPEQSGYFSGACGITFYGGGAFGDAFNGSIFVGDVVTNLVHRVALKPEGPLVLGHRGEGEERREFFASTDRAVRPVNLETGPDGALYILDFYRDVIEHPEWIPDEIEKELNIRAGEEKGRIFRIAPKGGLPRVAPKFDREKNQDVVAALADKNKWTRDTAQRLLIERNDPASVEPLKELARKSDGLARLHALRTLASLDQLDADLVVVGLKDKAAGMRENALQLAERFLGKPDKIAPALFDAIFAAAKDEDARVRMQAALTIGYLLGKDASDETASKAQAALLTIIERDHDEQWTRLAVLSGLGERPLPMYQAVLAKLSTDAATLGDGGKEFLKAVAEIIGAREEMDELMPALASARGKEGNPSELAGWILDGLAAGMERGGERDWMRESRVALEALILPLIDEANDPNVIRAAWEIANTLSIPPGEKQRAMLARAAKIAADAAAPSKERVAQLGILRFGKFEDREELLFGLLDIRHPAEVQEAAIEQLSHGPNEVVTPRLLKMWKQFGPEVRHRAGNILLYRRENHEALLAALESKDILIGQMNFDLERRRALLRSFDPAIRKRAQQLFTDAGVVTRADALEKMRPALKLKGAAPKGHELWKDRCSKCHVIGGEGHEVGSNLTDIFRKSGETLLHDIIDPNAAIDTSHISYTIVTKKGEILNGLIAAQSAGDVTLREGEAKETTIPRAEIREMYSSGLSLMPEELEKDMSQQDMADLLAFLQEPR